MGALKATKSTLKQAFPSAWLRWHFFRRPRSAEVELHFLKKIIPKHAVTVDVGANYGLYTRELARRSRQVHAFEPAQAMVDLLRRTAADNVSIHHVALSDREGVATLCVPVNSDEPVHSLASIEAGVGTDAGTCLNEVVRTVRLDQAVQDDVAFVKVDVEGHELSVLNGATGLLQRSQPVFLVEAEERHRASTTAAVFAFFARYGYRGYFLRQGDVRPVTEFDPGTMQDASALLANGGRKEGRDYINNFFFFPAHLDGRAILLG
ncbi:FkbM family methyltransferase [Afipia sp. P52-10]|uniref:FkbM family methyltransferase n=1 Tax=Afipia sp. P52-10 TaxID=1429916 RepID=UPI00054E4759|nr:FkbM family methyltransferase [Afipia sp. P52-10]